METPTKKEWTKPVVQHDEIKNVTLYGAGTGSDGPFGSDAS